MSIIDNGKTQRKVDASRSKRLIYRKCKRCSEILAVLKDLYSVTTSELSQKTKINQRTITRHLDEHLRQDKIVENVIITKKSEERQSTTTAWRLNGNFIIENNYRINIPYKVIIEPPKYILESDAEQEKSRLLQMTAKFMVSW